MKEALFYLKNDRVVKIALFTSLSLFLFELAFLAFHFRSLPPLIPLYFQRPWGMLQIAERREIFILPSLTLVLLIIDTYLSLKLYRETPLISRILLGGGALASLLSLISVVRITLLII